jgi:hypothetical protein
MGESTARSDGRQAAVRWWVVIQVAAVVCGAGVHTALSRPDSTPRLATGSRVVDAAHAAHGDRMSSLARATWHTSAHPMPVSANGVRQAGTSFAQDGQSTTGAERLDLRSPIQADAYGANLDFLGTCLSCTSARAGPNSSGAEARELRLAGEPVCEGPVPANGYSSGSLFTLPANPILRLAIADWDGVTRADRSSSQAHARGALLELAPGDGGLSTITVGESRSDASYGGPSSHASSESNGADAGLGGGQIAIVVLHSEGSSDGPGRVYLASVNGKEALPSTRHRGDNRITVPLVTTMAVLQGDATGAVVGSVSDGRSQRMVGIGTTWVGNPSSDPQPLR